MPGFDDPEINAGQGSLGQVKLFFAVVVDMPLERHQRINAGRVPAGLSDKDGFGNGLAAVL